MWSKYVAEKIERIPVVTKFLECFRSTAPGPARPVRTVVTPNDSERGPPETEEDKKVNALRDEISKRFKKHLEKQKNNPPTPAGCWGSALEKACPEECSRDRQRQIETDRDRQRQRDRQTETDR